MSDETKRPPWRPSEYKAEYCELVVQLGRQGYSLAEIGSALGASRNTVKNWANQHPEFLTAMELAKDESLSWWEKQGRDGVWNTPGGPSINSALYSRSMAARFPDDWRENAKLEHSGEVAVKSIRRVIVDPKNP